MAESPTQTESEVGMETFTQPEAEEGKEAVSVTGGLPSTLTQIQLSTINLVTIFGKGSDGRDVLVPLVDWSMSGRKGGDNLETPSEEAKTTLSSNLMTLDNLAFLLQDMGADIQEVTRLVAIQLGGNAPMHVSRMDYTAAMLRQAAQNLVSAAEVLDIELLKIETATSVED